MTTRTGIAVSYRNGREGQRYTLLETIGGGVAMFDYDQDGDLDLLFTRGGAIRGQDSTAAAKDTPLITGHSLALYRNDGDWNFVDVTDQAGLNVPLDYAHGVAVADYDRNGFPDLFVTTYGTCRLFHNEGGVFHDVTAEANLDFPGWSTAAAWADIDHDGFPDLYVANYVEWQLDPQEFCGNAQRTVQDVCPPQRYAGKPDRLFRNRGNGTFEEISAVVGLAGDGRGLGVIAADLNLDGWIDFYVANDAGPNHLYLGAATFPWPERGLWAGVANQEFGLAEGSMGVDLGDVNGDGLADIFVTNFEMENNTLYRGTGQGNFEQATLAMRLAGPCLPYVGFGTALADFDSDGWPDILVCNGHVYYALGQSPYAQPAFLFRNLAGQSFQNVSDRGGPYFSVPHVGRGAAIGDLDNDGALDVVIVHQNDPVVVLRNRQTPAHWISLQLEGVRCDREAVGASASVTFEGRQLTRWIRGGAGYLSHFDQRLLFPTTDATPSTVTVRWPAGDTELFVDLATNQTHRLVQGEGVPVESSND